MVLQKKMVCEKKLQKIEVRDRINKNLHQFRRSMPYLIERTKDQSSIEIEH
jgi:hypothetical protein